MKILEGNTIIKKIVLVLLVIIMLNNFIMPNYVRAEDIVTKLIKGFFGLLATIGDWILQGMQYIMMGNGELTSFGTYNIYYSPGIIFSDLVPSLKIDFVGQDEETSTIIKSGKSIDTKAELTAVKNWARYTTEGEVAHVYRC